MKRLAGWLGTFGAVVIAAVIAELLKQPLSDLEKLISLHRQAFLVATAGPGIVGFVLLISGVIYGSTRGKRLSHEEVEAAMSSYRESQNPGALWRKAKYRVAGRVTGGGFHIEISFREFKDLVAHPAEWHDPLAKVMLIMAAGGLLMFLGLFGFFIVIGPPLIKALMGVAMLYATVRMTWAFARA